MGFLRWQALRLSTPLREIAAREQTGPDRARGGAQRRRPAAGKSIATADVEELRASCVRRAGG